MALLAVGLMMAALLAPPSVWADSTPPPVPAPIPAPAPIPVPQLPTVRVGLGRSLTTLDLTAAGGIQIVAGGVVLWQSPAGVAQRITLVGGKIQVSGLPQALEGPVRFVPVQPAPALPTVPPASPVFPATLTNPILFGTKPYRGEMEVLVSPKDGKLSAVNVINLEEYLLGVVPYEMPASWSREAVKAQAVAARTYALRHKGNHVNEGFDLLDTTADQVYGGLKAEDSRASGAVAATRSQVVTYNGGLATTLFFSSSGGYTENNEAVFLGIPVPYLRGVLDYDGPPLNNPWYRWERTINLDQVVSAFRSRSYQIGSFLGLVPQANLTPGGRPISWQAQGTAGTETVNGAALRGILELPAAPTTAKLTVTGDAPAKSTRSPSETVFVIGNDGKPIARMVQGTAIIGATNPVTALNGDAHAIGAPAPETTLTITGGGYGHGVGMSQWGAYGLALLGKSYTDILAHYYQGTKVETR
jgi:stage II sporulation protein D